MLDDAHVCLALAVFLPRGPGFQQEWHDATPTYIYLTQRENPQSLHQCCRDVRWKELCRCPLLLGEHHLNVACCPSRCIQWATCLAMTNQGNSGSARQRTLPDPGPPTGPHALIAVCTGSVSSVTTVSTQRRPSENLANGAQDSGLRGDPGGAHG